jgi:tRNA-Thr(GGU) m(6)t(6)A37 methyltransferase TsaA
MKSSGCIVLFIFGCMLSLSAGNPPGEITNRPDTMEIIYHPIGRFHTELSTQLGAPRQGALDPANRGIIEIYGEYRGALTSLGELEYIIILYHMHLSKQWKPMVRPPGSSREFGLFATRSPNRPNSIGMGVVRLEKIEGNMIHVRGIDAFDGTPVLDIKPLLPSIDCPGEGDHTGLEKELGLKPQ